MNRFHLFISFLAVLALAASCTEASSPEGYRTIQDIVYAQPGAKPLKYDAYIPDGARNLPGIVIIHGGGWISNTEDMMGGLAREFVKDGKYVVFSIDYRWLGKGDGDEVANTMDQLIEDCFGAILHIRRHARKYGLDPDNIAVTGGSTGAHLAACMITLIERIGDEGFGAKPGVYQYQPTYKPRQMSLSRAREELARSIKAAAPSYGVFDAKNLLRFAPGFPLTCVVAIAPDNNIPPVAQRAVPQYILLGSLDRGVQREPIEAYVDHLHAAGQRAELVIVEGAEHAFFDWDPEQPAPEAFTQFGIPYAAEILRFFDETFY